MTGSSAVSGTVACGKPIAGATVTLMDANGHTGTATTASDGSYRIVTAGLVPPYLLQVTTSGGLKLYSLSANSSTATTINVTPLTDLMVRSWYGAQAVPVDSAFNAPAAYPPPVPATVATFTSGVVSYILTSWLSQANVAPASFSPVSTPFSANGQGVDRVLDLATVDAGTSRITISDGTNTTSSTINVSAAGSTVTLTISTSTNGGPYVDAPPILLAGTGTGAPTAGAALTSITVTPDAVALPLNYGQQYAATGTYSDNSTQDITNSVVWSSSDPSVLTMSPSGQGTPVSVGGANVIAAKGKIQGQTPVYVQNCTRCHS